MKLSTLKQDDVVQHRIGVIERPNVVAWGPWRSKRIDLSRTPEGRISCLAIQDEDHEFSHEELVKHPSFGLVFICGPMVMEIVDLEL